MDYPLDSNLRKIIDSWDCGWLFALQHSNGLPEALLDRLRESGYSKKMVESELTQIKSTKIEDLVTLALKDKSDDSPALAALGLLESEAVFETAKSLCRSKNAEERSLGVRVLMRKPGETFYDESTLLLSDLIQSEENDTVLEDLIYSLFHLKVQGRSGYFAKLLNHPNRDIRLAVAFSSEKNKEAISALRVLANDSDDEVRGLAVSQLCDLVTLDTEVIPLILLERLAEDRQQDIRNEAMLGLAKQRDPRVIPFIAESLLASEVWIGAINSAKEMPDPSFYPLLIKLKHSNSSEELDQAIDLCGGSQNSTEETL